MENSDHTAATIEEIKTKPDLSEIHHKIQSLIISRQLQLALEESNAAIALDNGNAESHYLKGKIYYFLHHSPLAEASAIQAIALDNFSVDYYVLLALIYQRKRLLEEALHILERGLSYNSSHLQAVQMKTILLIKLFRLQEAYSFLQKTQRLQQEQLANSEAITDRLIEEDPEQLYEQALTVDPFKTKSRMDSLDTVKAQRSFFRSLSRLRVSSYSSAISGFFILIGLISAALFFFQDGATYKRFSLLLFAISISSMLKAKALSLTTNFPVFMPSAFRGFIQRRDILFSVKAILLFLVAVTCFFLWHYYKWYTALVFEIISVGLFQILEDDLPTGRTVPSFSIPQPPVVKKAIPVKYETVTLNDAPYDMLFPITRKRLFGTKQLAASFRTVLKYGLLVLFVYPILFFILRWTDVVSSYTLLLLPEVAVVFVIQQLFSLAVIQDFPVFYPVAARKFLPSYAVRKAFIMLVLQASIITSIYLWLHLDNGYVLLVTLILIVLVIKLAFTKPKTNAPGLLKEELVAYIVKHHSQQTTT